jgi:hypothetical protein
MYNNFICLIIILNFILFPKTGLTKSFGISLNISFQYFNTFWSNFCVFYKSIFSFNCSILSTPNKTELIHTKQYYYKIYFNMNIIF